MKILHTADWHLGTFRSPVKDGVNLRTEDTKRCLDELIRVANEEKPDYSLVSGDIFHVGRLWSDRCCEEIITAIHYSNAMAIFATENFEICTRLVQGEYYKYQNMFKELPLHTVISRKELLDAMVRAKMCTAEKCPVKFEIAGSQLSLSIKDQTTDYHETVDLQEDISEELTIGFDARLVIETLKAFDCDNVGISLHSPKMPMIIEAEDSDFKTIVLPVTIK